MSRAVYAFKTVLGSTINVFVAIEVRASTISLLSRNECNRLSR